MQIMIKAEIYSKWLMKGENEFRYVVRMEIFVPRETLETISIQ